MENKTVAFCTLGCKVNQYETNAMIQEFMKKGYTIVEFDEKADIYIVNTCTVTNMADRKSRQMLRRVKELNPDAILVAVGCYAQVARDELEKIPEIDLILGNNEKKEIVNIVAKKLKIDKIENKQNKGVLKRCNLKGESIKDKIINNEKQTKNTFDKNILVENNKSDNAIETNEKSVVTDVLHCEQYVDLGDVTFTEKTRAVIKVQDGCDRFCSYCIIPFARGHIRSRKPENVVSEITKIAEKGIKEVVITGIHLASYGRDFNNENSKIKIEEKSAHEEVHCNNEYIQKQNYVADNGVMNNLENVNSKTKFGLVDLLEKINEIDGIERIRLRFFRANVNNKRICR